MINGIVYLNNICIFGEHLKQIGIMTTKYLDSEIKRLSLLQKKDELSDWGKKLLNELKEIKQELIIKNAIIRFSLEDVKEISIDIMNLGMDLRQNQLNGSDLRSGNEVIKEYFKTLPKN